MYRANLSFTTNTYDVRKNQILPNDFTTEDQIEEYLDIGYIEVYDDTIEITENGMYNVEDYQNADVDVPSQAPTLQEKSVTITTNTTEVVEPETGYDALSKVTVTTNVPIPTPSLQNKSETITENTTTTIEADSGYDGLGTVTITTNVGGASYPPDWSQIGYTNTPPTILDNFAYSKNISDNWDSNQSILYNKFSGNNILIYMPLVDTHNALDMNGMFSNCSNLQMVPSLNSSNVTDMYRMFYYCQKLVSVGELNAIQVTRMEDMFRSCTNLEQVSIINTDNVTNMRNMFNNCIKLTSISLPNTSKLQNASQMFFNCSSLTTITQLDMSKVTQATQMFQGCTSLVTIPQLDISAITNSYYIQNMFNSCNSLSDESLNNILAMCINASVTSTLAYLGLTSAQATTCQGLSNYQDFIDAGWTTGY